MNFVKQILGHIVLNYRFAKHRINHERREENTYRQTNKGKAV